MLQACNQELFWAEQVSWNRGTSINTSCTIYKRRAPQGKIFLFFSMICLKLHLKWEFNPQMYTNRAIFSKIRALFVYFQKRQGKPPTLSLSSCAPKLIHFRKRGWCNSKNVHIQQKLTFAFKKPSFTWLVAAILV